MFCVQRYEIFFKRQRKSGKTILPEVPVLDVVVELDAIGAAELGYDVENLFLLFWREQVLSMMVAVVRSAAITEVTPYPAAGLGLIPLRNVVVEMGEAPCFLHPPFFAETLALAVLPGRRKDSRSVITLLGHQQSGLIMHATVFPCAFIVEAQGIAHGNIFVCQFLLVHVLVCKDTKLLSSWRAKIQNFLDTAKKK